MFASPLALKLKKPFIMLRKSGKLPNAVESGPYTKEYKVGRKEKKENWGHNLHYRTTAATIACVFLLIFKHF